VGKETETIVTMIGSSSFNDNNSQKIHVSKTFRT